MKIFLDTASVADVAAAAETGLINGVTTNPSLIAKSGAKLDETIAQMCDLVDGPVSAEVVAQTAAAMIEEGKYFAQIAKNVCVKVPLTRDGLIACKTLSDSGIDVNVTLCFSPAQALLAAKAGARFISPFIGRIDDVGGIGLHLIREIIQIYDNYPNLETEILAASIRSPQHVVEAAKLGADVATIPPKLFNQMYQHPLTDKGLDQFMEDWNASGQELDLKSTSRKAS